LPGWEVYVHTTHAAHRDPPMNAPPEDKQPPAAGTPPSAATEAGGSSARAVTIKSVLASMLGIVAIGLYSNTNDRVLKLSPLVGNHLPVAAFSLILVLAIIWNPLIGRWWQALRFGTKELALVLGVMLVCSWIPGSSFYRYFPYSIITPWTSAKSHADWQKEGTLGYLPPKLFPLHHDSGADADIATTDEGPLTPQQRAYERVYGSFTSGLREGTKNLTLSQVPIREWSPIAVYWGPLLLVMGICLMAMIWMLHRQWAHHEQLAYPIASVATALIERTGARLTSDLFYSRLFWFGFVPVFCIHMVNYLSAWFPDVVPHIALGLFTWDDHTAFPILLHVPTDKLGTWNLYFAVIGLSYFIPSEISLSMGLSPVISTLIGVQVYLFSGSSPTGDDEHSVQAGAYLTYFLILVYTGRLYLKTVFSRALGLSRYPTVDATQVWAARLFIGAAVLFVMLLIGVFHLDWFIAVIYSCALFIYFLVFARIIAETGIPFLQADWSPGMTLCHICGFPAIGPSATVLIIYLNSVLNPDARECLTPYVANSLKLFENVGVKTSRLVQVGIVGMAVALIVGFLAVIYSIYNNGATDAYPPGRTVAVLTDATGGLATLRDTGLMHVSRETHGLAKLGLIGKNVGHGEPLAWMGVGMIGVVIFSALRFRFLWWPLHPVIFLMCGTWTISVMWVSFLIGWLIKHLIVRYGGGKTYQSLKPVFLGLIMGELFAVTVQLVVGFIYYKVTGHIDPKSTAIFPG